MQYETHGDYTILYIPHYTAGCKGEVDKVHKVIIDTEDLFKVLKFEFVVNTDSRNGFRVSERQSSKGSLTYLSTVLLNLKKGEKTRHINGKWNDFRKRNLKRIVPKQQQKEAMARLNALLGI